MFAIRSAAIAAVFSMLAVVARAEGIVHKLAVQVDENDPAVMNLAFNNARNVRSYYETKGEKVQIEIVAYEPGLNMLVAEKSPVEERISARENTPRGMVKKAGKDVPLMSEAAMVPSGVVRLMKLRTEGYAYVRP